MKTAVIYARYSSDSQTEQSIEGQLHVCQDYAQRNGIVILDTYIDRAMTGTNDNRPDFRRMIADSSKKQWNYVLVYKFDRFSRNKYETAMHKHTLKENGVKVLSAMENIPDSPEGIILESVIEGMNQYYSEELSQKVKRGMKETRAKGNFTGGTLIYGYKVENHKVVIDNDSAEVVKYIFHEYAMGVYVTDIIDELNKQGILNKGKPFARNTVYNILKNEKYSGIYKHEDEIFDNIYPQIVPTDIFAKVRIKVEKNKNGKRSMMTRYLLKNKVICGYCGNPITGIGGTSHTGKTAHYYKCKGRNNGSNCHKTMIRQEVLDNFVLDCVVAELSKPQVLDNVVKYLLKLQDEMIDNNPATNLLLKEKRSTEVALENVMKAIEMGIMNNTTNKRMQELENKLDELEQKILIEKSKSETKLDELQIREFYDEAMRKEAPQLIDVLIKKVVLFDDKIEIHYNTPLTISPDEQSGLFLCNKTGKTPLLVRNRKLYGKYVQVDMYV